MAQRTGLRDDVIAVLERNHELSRLDLGADAHLQKKGMAFETEAWEVQGIGHLCAMQMNAFLGLMRMETVVIAPTAVDAPLFNMDWVKALGTETQIAEMYDTQIEPWPEECQAALAHVCDTDEQLPDAAGGDARWYDEILYPCTFHKKGRGLTVPLSQAAHDYLEVYAELLAVLPPCDEQEKAGKVRAFAERLFAEGGPAVDQVTKLFGDQTARRLILQHMYGVRL